MEIELILSLASWLLTQTPVIVDDWFALGKLMRHAQDGTTPPIDLVARAEAIARRKAAVEEANRI
jgi:hypothetical protein